MRRALVLLLFLAACGENAAPTIDSLRLSNPTGRRFQEFFITLVGVQDPDGNVYAGKVLVNAKSADGEFELKSEVLPFEPDRDQTRGDVIVGANIVGPVSVGIWNLDVIFEDEGGAQSETAHAEITLTQ